MDASKTPSLRGRLGTIPLSRSKHILVRDAQPAIFVQLLQDGRPIEHGVYVSYLNHVTHRL